MRIKELIKNDAGFLFIIDSLDIQSAAGRRHMLNTEFSNDPTVLETEWSRLAEAIRATNDIDNRRYYIDLRHCLMCLHDLSGTFTSLANRTPLNEVELFEIKNLCYMSKAAATAIQGLSLTSTLPLPDCSAVFDLLDPDHTGIANFYIYDSYDIRLAPLRRELNALQTSGGDPMRISNLLAEQSEIQNEVCLRLTDQLHPYVDTLVNTLNQMAYADGLLARAKLAIEWELVRPAIGDVTRYTHIFNPRLKQRNLSQKLRYQPVSIEIRPGVCLITGANMAGKTVLLKSVGTAQMMAQCGMYVPAEEAIIHLVEGVATSIGDDQDEMNGLSSYASEIIKISNILADCRQRELLVLIDEPARTTNPVEGKALVQAIIKILEQQPSFTLITTHYDQLGSNCRRLRVKGFVEDMENIPLTPQSINRFIDYSLTEDQSDDVPHEALRIASILQCDPEMIALASAQIQ